MLVGLSLARCVKDIVNDEVHEDEVLCIIAGTKFNWENSHIFDELWSIHSHKNLFNNDSWFELEKDLVYELIDYLWLQGKIHQPKLYHRTTKIKETRYHWLECNLPQEHSTPTVQEAWDQYKFLAGLTGEEKLIDK